MMEPNGILPVAARRVAGKVGFVVTSGDHVSLRTREKNADSDVFLVANGIPVYASVHLYLRAGMWVHGAACEVYVVRRDRWHGDGVPEGTRRAVVDALAEAWAAYAKSAPSVLSEAAECHKAGQLDKLRARRDELRGELAGVEAEIKAAEGE